MSMLKLSNWTRCHVTSIPATTCISSWPCWQHVINAFSFKFLGTLTNGYWTIGQAAFSPHRPKSKWFIDYYLYKRHFFRCAMRFIGVLFFPQWISVINFLAARPVAYRNACLWNVTKSVQKQLHFVWTLNANSQSKSRAKKTQLSIKMHRKKCHSNTWESRSSKSWPNGDLSKMQFAFIEMAFDRWNLQTIDRNQGNSMHILNILWP